MEYRFLTPKDEAQLTRLIEKIESSLPDKEWWLPIQESARQHFFDSEWTMFYGAFDHDELVAACALFLTANEYGETISTLGLPDIDMAEIGRCMVNPEYRGQNLMLKLNKALVEHATSNGIRHIVATAHPMNMASCASLIALGMRHAGNILKYNGYQRNIYLLDIQ